MGSKAKLLLGGIFQGVGQGVASYGAEIRSGKLRALDRQRKESDTAEGREFTRETQRLGFAHAEKQGELGREASIAAKREQILANGYTRLQTAIDKAISNGILSEEDAAQELENRWAAFQTVVRDNIQTDADADELTSEIETVVVDEPIVTGDDVDDDIDGEQQDPFDKAIAEVRKIGTSGAGMRGAFGGYNTTTIAKRVLDDANVDLPDDEFDAFVELLDKELQAAKVSKEEATAQEEAAEQAATDERLSSFREKLSATSSAPARTTGELPTINNAEEYDALPSGTRYKDQNGITRIKQ